MAIKLPNFRDPKVKLAAGAAAAVGVFALWRRAQSASSASSTPTGTVTDPTAAAALDASTLENSIVGDLQPQIDSLSAQLSGLKPSTPAAAVPPPKPKAPPTPAPKAGRLPLPPVNPGKFPTQIPLNAIPAADALTILGSVGAGGKFTGHNVAGGAPVYAILPPYGVAIQGFNAKNLPAGTKLATLKSLAKYVQPGTVRNEQLP